MSERITRRALLATVLGAGTVGLAASDVRPLLEQFAPLSGSAWDAAGRSPNDDVVSPYGEATIYRDEEGVPHVEADDEDAAYFAVGYVQGFDRLFQLDIQRRQMRGQLSEIAGPATLESDEFHVAMDFAGAAEATWEAIEDTDHASRVRAFADGVNAVIEDEQLPLEFEIIEYEPRPWTPEDTMLLQKQIAWTLTGNFDELRRERIVDALGQVPAAELFPRELDHDVPILRSGDESLGDVGGADVEADAADEADNDGDDDTDDDETNGDADDNDADDNDNGDETNDDADDDSTSERVRTLSTTNDRTTTGLVEWLSQFESPTGVGSNSWVVSGEHTRSGRPILANDPHLLLTTPPIWYEQHVETPERNVRGVTFPGVPFVVIGANERGAWGFTNVGADVLDCYRYERDASGERYRYGDEWREFAVEEREIAVDGEENETVTVRKTVHGPFLEREGEHVGVAWTGLAATRTSRSIDRMGRSDGLEDVLAAIETFDEPTQNLVYADADGRTAYYVTGQLPIRTVDGEVVRGDQVFDGSAGEGEWDGYTPYEADTWEGFVPFDEKPHAIDPGVLATANQRVADDPDHYVGTAYAAPYRGGRLYDRLDELTLGDDSTTMDDHAALQTDRIDPRAVQLVPELTDAVASEVETEGRLTAAAEALDDWDYEMTPDSRPALVFARWFERFRAVICEPHFQDAGLDESYYPNDWVLATLPAESEFFDEATRAETMVTALEATLTELETEEWETYGDYNTTAPIEHPFGAEAPFLNYDERPIGGSRATINNYRVDSAVGASNRLLAEPGGEMRTILPGGNSGEYFSEHYDDQFQDWIDGDYRAVSLEIEGEPLVSFEEGSR